MNTTFVDTHCHLNFSRFKKTYKNEVLEAQNSFVSRIIVPGTDIPSSIRAIEIAQEFDNVYTAIGIHPHHAFEIDPKNAQEVIDGLISSLKELVNKPKVVAIGEVGLDRHVYEQTKYSEYAVTSAFITTQTHLLSAQMQLALHNKKALILHNRETKQEMMDTVKTNWDTSLEHKSVFHCCEPDKDLLAFAQIHSMYIGVDGDVTYGGSKASFIREVPLDMLVLETDSPFLLPEPLKSEKKYPNSPKNIPLIAQEVARLKGMSVEVVASVTTENALNLFSLH